MLKWYSDQNSLMLLDSDESNGGTSYTQLTQLMEQMNATINSQRTINAFLQNQISEMNETINNLQTTMSNQQEIIDNHNTTINNHGNSISTHEVGINALQAKDGQYYSTQILTTCYAIWLIKTQHQIFGIPWKNFQKIKKTIPLWKSPIHQYLQYNIATKFDSFSVSRILLHGTTKSELCGSSEVYNHETGHWKQVVFKSGFRIL